MKFLSTAVLLLTILHTAVAQSSIFAGGFVESNNNNINVQGRAATCPASNCDGTGILEHHLADNGSGFGQSVACLSPSNPPNVGEEEEFTGETSYLRCFAGSLCAQARTVNSVTFRVKELEGSSSIEARVNIYKGGSNGCATDASVASLFRQTPAATAVVIVSPSNTGFELTVPISLTLLPSESILVEIEVPDLFSIGGKFYLGDSNDAEQCEPSYIQCRNLDPLDTTEIQNGEFSLVSFIISVNTSPISMPTAPMPVPMPVPMQPTFPPITSAPAVAPEPTCFDSIGAIVGCIFQYLFGWLLPF